MSRTLRLFLLAVLAGFALNEIIVRLFFPVRNIGPSFSEYDPIYGKSLKKNLACTRITPEFRMSFSTNSLGFRGPELSASPERPILFLGDSFTEGYGVNDGEEFPALVREGLKQRYGPNAPPVINAGIGNTGNGRWIKFLRREGHQYNPRLVMLQLSGNDFEDNLTDGLFTLSDDGSLVEHDPPSPGAFRMVQAFIDAVPGLAYSHLVGLIREAYYYTRMGTDDAGDENTRRQRDRLTFAIVEEIIRYCRQAQWPIVVIIVGFDADQRKGMQSVLEDAGIPYIVPPDKAERPDLYYAIDGHWNSKGHEHVALQVMETLGALPLVSRERTQ
ncbi:MAG TPA: GDSL-type esterase/lipase family protein [Bacteroidota bacterium]|nr:GDSL-type esterase/lipase family protein [Bacteroidota bacterium]